jgi:hypothetical protein
MTPCCDYCGNEAKLKQKAGRWRWECKPCGAGVGVYATSVHTKRFLPMGRLLKAEGEKRRKKAARMFKVVWQHHQAQGHTKNQARDIAYYWLHQQLGFKVHIEQADEAQLERIIEVCRDYNGGGA